MVGWQRGVVWGGQLIGDLPTPLPPISTGVIMRRIRKAFTVVVVGMMFAGGGCL